MRFRIDLSRPDISYVLIWGLAFSLIQMVEMDYIYPMQADVTMLIGINIVSFWLIYVLMRHMFRTIRGPLAYELPDMEIYSLSRFCTWLFIVWVPFYLLAVIFSGGLPVYWLLSGSALTYVDFGIPTFSGLLNMIRTFIFSAGLLVFLNTKKRSALALPLIMLCSGLAEVSRGNLTVMLMHGVGIYLLYTRNMFRTFLFAMIMGTVFIYMFGVLSEFRGGVTPVEELVGEDSVFLSLPEGVFWVYTYLASPLNNINYAYLQGIEPLFYPFHSLQPLVPTVIRNMIFPASEYPIELAVEAFNATTFYAPLIVDFGIVGAGLSVIVLQFITAYFHVKAKTGHIFYILAYPALFMCVVMSIFYMYFFSMVVVFYPLLVMLYMVFRKSLWNRYRKDERTGML